MSSYKTTLKQQLNSKNKQKTKSKAKPFISFWLSYDVFMSGAWKNVGMTMLSLIIIIIIIIL